MIRCFWGCLAVTLTAAIGAGCAGGAANTGDAFGIDTGTAPDSALPPNDTAGPAARLFDAPACGDNEAPLPNGLSPMAYACVAVGASQNSATGHWPDTTGARAPLIYVDNAAPAGGDGSSPSRALAGITDGISRVTMLGEGTVVLAAGTYSLNGGTLLNGNMGILGAGPMQTVIQPAAGATVTSPFLSVAPGADVNLSGLRIASDTHFATAALALGAHASATVNDVEISAFDVGIDATTATVNGDGFTVRDSGRGAMLLKSGSDATLRNLLVRGGTGFGIQADGSRVTVVQGLIAGTARAGVVLTGAAPIAHDHLERLAVTGVSGIGIYVNGAGRVVDGTLLMVAGVGTAAGLGGDGLVVVNGGSVTLDPTLTSDAVMGLGSQFRANAHVGILASGSNTTMLIRGITAGSNGHAGVVLQSGAVAHEVGYSIFSDNAGAGMLTLSNAVVGYVACNGFIANRLGHLGFADMTQLDMADGLVLAGTAPAGGSTVISGNQFAQQSQYGLLIEGVSADLRGNVFSADMFGYASFNGGTLMSDTPTADATRMPAGGMNPLTSPPPGVTEPAP